MAGARYTGTSDAIDAIGCWCRDSSQENEAAGAELMRMGSDEVVSWSQQGQGCDRTLFLYYEPRLIRDFGLETPR